MTPMERPDLSAVDEYFKRLAQHPGFLKHCCNGLP
jgi:glutathione S-transferase